MKRLQLMGDRVMTLHLRPVTEENFWSIINLKSEREQEKTLPNL